MREIKFRAWLKKEKYMVHDAQETYDGFRHLSDLPKEVDYYVADCFGDLLSDKNVVVMQYANVKDANGIDVYEDDIIEWEVRDGQKVRTQIRIFGIFTIGQFLTGWRKDPPTKHFEVIGNLYQNPELLK